MWGRPTWEPLFLHLKIHWMRFFSPKCIMCKVVFKKCADLRNWVGKEEPFDCAYCMHFPFMGAQATSSAGLCLHSSVLPKESLMTLVSSILKSLFFKDRQYFRQLSASLVLLKTNFTTFRLFLWFHLSTSTTLALLYPNAKSTNSTEEEICHLDISYCRSCPTYFVPYVQVDGKILPGGWGPCIVSQSHNTAEGKK